MSTSVEQFNYDLPPEFIAQEPVEPRDQSRLLILDRGADLIEHKRFFEIKDFLRDDDVLVFNDTKVFKARLKGMTSTGVSIEVFLLRAEGHVWQAMVRPGRKVQVGSEIVFEDELKARVVEKQPNGIVKIEFDVGVDQVLDYCDKYGEIPVPPYVKQQPEDLDTYQTVYARETGSVAAPTAGFHFTERLMDELRDRGIQMEYITLHVGIGTFQPVKTDTLEEHEIHSEFVQIDQGTAERINKAKAAGRRIVAVGTTTTRALEGVSNNVEEGFSLPSNGTLKGSATLLRQFAGDVDIFITPGYEFKAVDALITNFHLPKSTLLALVSALASREQIFKAYEEAKQHGYRFYSFGDAMLIK
jgi:S-adenosylmethionine:tRNA ribosyltransferase-isomerase